MPRPVVVAILVSAVAVMMSTGSRQTSGLFLEPITRELGSGREIFGLAMAIGTLINGLPVMGMLTDRFGARRILGIGGAIYGVGLFLMTRWVTELGVISSFGILQGIAQGTTTYVVVIGAVGRLVPDEQRSRVFGILTAMGSAGFLVMPTLSQLWMDQWGWKVALTIQAGLVLSIVALSLGLPAREAQPQAAHQALVPEMPMLAFIREGLKQPSYLLLIAGFFVCGFHVSFIGVHLPVYLSDHGLSHIRGVALALIGAFNLIGSLSFGWLGDRWPRRYLLSLIYGSRGVLLALFFLLPVTFVSTVLFSSLMGLVWLATVPLTSGIVARFFGSRYLATMYGIVFFSHQLGGFLGAWLPGRIYDGYGHYDLIFYAAVALGLFGFLIHFPIRERSFPIHLEAAQAA